MPQINLGKVRGEDGNSLDFTVLSNTVTNYQLRIQKKSPSGTVLSTEDTPNLRVNIETIFNTVYPVGIYLVQFPGMPSPSVLFSISSGYPSSSWSMRFSNDSVFFCTEGSYSLSFNGGIGSDAIKSHYHLTPFGRHDSWIMNAAFGEVTANNPRGNSSTGIITSAGVEHRSNSPTHTFPKTSTAGNTVTTPRYRSIRVWERIS